MNTDQPVGPRRLRRFGHALQGLFWGVTVNVMIFALLGILLGLALMLIYWIAVEVILREGYRPSYGSFLVDLVAVIWRWALYFSPIGIFTGAVIGLHLASHGDEDLVRPKEILGVTMLALIGGSFMLTPMLLLTVWPLYTVYDDLYQTVGEVTVTSVQMERPIVYFVDLPTPEGYKQMSVQDSSAVPQVQAGETLRVVHRGKIWEGRLLLPGQGIPVREWSGKSYFLCVAALFSLIVFGGLWAFFYCNGVYNR
jgi:hypothetical protein